MVQPYVFATDSLRPRDQYEAWRGWFRPIFEVVPSEHANSGFPARGCFWDLGNLAMSRVSAPAVKVTRTRANLIRDPADHWVISYCRQGTTVLRIDDTVLHVPAGVPFIWSLAQTLQSERSAVDRIQLFLPRSIFHDISALLDGACPSALDNAEGRLLGDFMLALERRLSSLTETDLPRLAEMVRGMVIACVMPTGRSVMVQRYHVEAGLLERVRQVVRANVRSPALGPSSLCRLLEINPSDLRRLFKGTGGISHYIRLQRLLAAHAELSVSASRTSVSNIASRYGFPDTASFGRAFRREFGYSPTRARALAAVQFCDFLHGP